MRFVEFNLNEYVWVQLTDKGRQIYQEWVEDLGLDHTPAEEDPDGWSKWQAWQLAQLFGEYMGMGVFLPFATTVRIDPKTASRISGESK